MLKLIIIVLLVQQNNLRVLNKADVGSDVEHSTDNLTDIRVVARAMGEPEHPLVLTPHRDQVEHLHSSTALDNSTPCVGCVRVRVGGKMSA